jgi:hypothetical protein
MYMTDSRRHGHRTRAKYRQDPKVLCPVLDEYLPERQCLGQWLIYDQYRWRFVMQGD